MKLNYYLGLLLFLLITLFSSHRGQAQNTYSFGYDARGNRIKRKVIVLNTMASTTKSATIPNDSVANPFDKPLEDQIGLQEIRIYPNPTKGIIKIDFPAKDNSSDAIVRVHDSQGRLIIRERVSDIAQVDLTRYPSGFYIMIIRVGQEKKEWKIIKE